MNKRWVFIVTSLWLLILGVLTLIQSSYWHNTRTLFEYEMAVNPNSDIAYNNLANYYNFRGSPIDQEKALGYAETMVQKFPKLADGYFVEGSTLAALGRHEQAIAALREGLQLEPNNMTALGNLASSLAAEGQLNQAMQTIRQVLDFSPEDADAHRNYGGMLYVTHRDAEAQREFEAAIRYNPEDYQAHTALARLLAEKGQTQEAADHYQAALSINPQYTPALEGLGRLRGFYTCGRDSSYASDQMVNRELRLVNECVLFTFSIHYSQFTIVTDCQVTLG
jgi:tetratricopeptide (TPR) repeat protein